MNKIRDLFSGLKDLTTVGVVDIVSTAISGFFWFYIASIVGAEQYGQISYLMAIGAIVSSVALLGSEHTLTVYTAKNVKLQSAIYLLSIVSGVISSLVIFVILGEIEVSLLVIGYVISTIVIAETLGRKAFISYSRYTIASKILMVTFSIGLYYTFGVAGIIIGIALSLLIFLYGIINVFRTTKIDFALVRPRMKFMITSYITNLSDRFKDSLDKLIIAPMLGFLILGNYQLGLQFLEVLFLLPAIVYKYVLPHDASGNPNKKLKNITILSSLVISVLTVLLAPYAIPVVFPQYVQSIQVIQLLSISLVPGTMNLMYHSKFLGTERNKILLYASIIFLSVEILGIIVLGSIFGVTGAAIGYNIGVISQTIFYFGVTQYAKQQDKKNH